MISLRSFKKWLVKRSGIFFFLLPFTNVMPATYAGTPPSLAHAVQIPAEFGNIRTVQEGRNGKTIILIEEAHADYRAQKAIAEILYALTQQQALRLVLVEGGWEDVSLSYLRNRADSQTRFQVAERFLREGKISGEEYLDLTSEVPLELWGIDDRKLYRENILAFFQLRDHAQELLAGIAKLKTFLEEQIEKELPAVLQTLLRLDRDWEEGKLALTAYLASLAKLAGPEMLKEFPELGALLELSGNSRSGLDPEKAAWEKEELVRRLTRIVSAPELDRLRIHEPIKSLEEEARQLRAVLEMAKRHAKAVQAESYANLEAYLVNLENMAKADTKQLFAALDGLKQKLADSRPLSKKQKQWIRIIQNTRILEKLFSLKLTSEEFEKFDQNSGGASFPHAFRRESDPRLKHSGMTKEALNTSLDFNLGRWEKFLRKSSNSLPEEISRQMTGLEKWIGPAKSFYLLARKREEALVANALAKIETEGAPLSACIIGGFHTENIGSAFSNRGYSVVYVSPRFEVHDPDGLQQQYFQALKHKFNFPREEKQK